MQQEGGKNSDNKSETLVKIVIKNAMRLPNLTNLKNPMDCYSRLSLYYYLTFLPKKKKSTV